MGKLGPKIQSCLFCLQSGTHGISRMLILIPTSVFWISNPKIHFWANLGQKVKSFFQTKKVKVVSFSWKLALMVFRGCRFWVKMQSLVFSISNQESVLGKFRLKKSKLSVLPENWHTWYHEDANYYFNICFLNFKSNTNVWANLGNKSQICSF